MCFLRRSYANTLLRLYTFAAHPELGPILLEDVNQALEESSGEWTNAALQNMKKLDSFLKEVGRYEPFTACKWPSICLT